MVKTSDYKKISQGYVDLTGYIDKNIKENYCRCSDGTASQTCRPGTCSRKVLWTWPQFLGGGKVLGGCSC